MRFWQKSRHFIIELSHYLAKPHLLFYALPWLMVLLILGTIAQKDLGVYVATEKYFNSFITWMGPIPTPGGLSTIGLIFIALTIKFIFFSPWQWKKSGTILTHLGVLLLLIGGIITALTSKEGFMIIPEGQEINKISDYRARVLNFYQDEQIIKTVSFRDLKIDQVFEIDNIKIKILMTCDNCDAQAPSGQYDNLQGLAVNMELFSIPEEKNSEVNFSGLILSAETGKTAQNGTYIVMEDIPKNPILKGDSGNIEIKLERAKTPLVFGIHLKDFRKIDYPGTNKAREFESDLLVQDGDLEWPVTISMNQPLRYKGYTFYQSSFDTREDKEVTVLNVVENKGRIFPYISTLIIFAGLLLHSIIRLQSYKDKAI